MANVEACTQKILFVIVIIDSLCICILSFFYDKKLYTIYGNTMGTTFSIKYYARNAHDNEDISNNVNSILREVNSKFSTYDKESEISKFNALKSNTPFKMSADFKYLINKSFSLNELTDGRYDITIDPLLKVWGFYSKQKKYQRKMKLKKQCNQLESKD
ncbi:FAD:protein FMN transferase [Paraphotobacterium marinum]|uniref:FAD:protein FMN transferase n=1 Tax=Paraphotobacterium marinum TaxID=1755811 RepID=UPI0013148066